MTGQCSVFTCLKRHLFLHMNNITLSIEQNLARPYRRRKRTYVCTVAKTSNNWLIDWLIGWVIKNWLSDNVIHSIDCSIHLPVCLLMINSSITRLIKTDNLIHILKGIIVIMLRYLIWLNLTPILHYQPLISWNYNGYRRKFF